MKKIIITAAIFAVVLLSGCEQHEKKNVFGTTPAPMPTAPIGGL